MKTKLVTERHSTIKFTKIIRKGSPSKLFADSKVECATREYRCGKCNDLLDLPLVALNGIIDGITLECTCSCGMHYKYDGLFHFLVTGLVDDAESSK